MPKIIGITGFARSGKDTFYLLSKEVLKEEYGLESTRVAFADQLKSELQDLIRDSFGLDIFNLKPEQKEDARNLMVEWGRLARTWSNGSYWVDRLKEKVDRIKNNPKGIKVVFTTDCRYQNEIDWLISEGGDYIAINKFNKEENAIFCNSPSSTPHTNDVDIQILNFNPLYRKEYYTQPANQEEKETITPLIQNSDNLIVWPHVGNNNIQSLKPFVSEFWKKNPQLLETKH